MRAWMLALLAIAAPGFPQARQIDQAAALLDGSLQFFPEYSESCLLYARLRLREQEGTRAGLDWLKRALASGTWTVTDPAQASTELAAVLVRTRRFAEGRSVLASSVEAGSAGPGLGARDD